MSPWSPNVRVKSNTNVPLQMEKNCNLPLYPNDLWPNSARYCYWFLHEFEIRGPSTLLWMVGWRSNCYKWLTKHDCIKVFSFNCLTVKKIWAPLEDTFFLSFCFVYIFSFSLFVWFCCCSICCCLLFWELKGNNSLDALPQGFIKFSSKCASLKSISILKLLQLIYKQAWLVKLTSSREEKERNHPC